MKLYMVADKNPKSCWECIYKDCKYYKYEQELKTKMKWEDLTKREQEIRENRQYDCPLITLGILKGFL